MRTKYFEHLNTGKIPEVKRFVDNAGLRRYSTTFQGNSLYTPVSITTMLSTRHNPALEKWIETIGIEEAERQRNIAAAQGTSFHAACEAYLKNEENFPESASMPNIVDLFRRAQPELDNIDIVYHQEIPLFGIIRKITVDTTKDYAIAGTPDCIGRYNGVDSIIDFKNSTRPKTGEQIYNYILQVTAYKEMYQYMTGIDIPRFAIIIACEELPQAQVCVGRCDDYKNYLINFVESYYLTHEQKVP